MTATDGGEHKDPTPTKAPDKKPPRVQLFAECRGWHADLGGVRYKQGEIVKLTGALEAEARANPSGWRIFVKEG